MNHTKVSVLDGFHIFHLALKDKMLQDVNNLYTVQTLY